MSDKYDHLPVDPAELSDLLEEAHRDSDEVEPTAALVWAARHPAEAD